MAGRLRDVYGLSTFLIMSASVEEPASGDAPSDSTQTANPATDPEPAEQGGTATDDVAGKPSAGDAASGSETSSKASSDEVAVQPAEAANGSAGAADEPAELVKAAPAAGDTATPATGDPLDLLLASFLALASALAAFYSSSRTRQRA